MIYGPYKRAISSLQLLKLCFNTMHITVMNYCSFVAQIFHTKLIVVINQKLDRNWYGWRAH